MSDFQRTALNWAAGGTTSGRAGFSIADRGFFSWPSPTPETMLYGYSPSAFDTTSGLINEWVDAFGGATLTNTGASRPAESTLNGHPCAEFTKATPDYLAQFDNPYEADSSGEVWMVVRSTNWAADAVRGVIMFSVANYPLYYEMNFRVWGTDRVGAGGARKAGLNINPGTSGGLSVVELYGDTTLSDNTTYLIRWNSDGSEIKMWVNGVAQSLTINAGANDGAWFSIVASGNRTYLGDYVNPGFYSLDGKIAYFMVLPGVLTDQGALTWTNFLMSVFGIS